VTLNVQLQVFLSAEKFAANLAGELPRLEVQLPVLLQLLRGRENESAIAKSALDLASNWH
jgi:hypothetical protein